MIKNGFRIKDIADFLNTSPRAVPEKVRKAVAELEKKFNNGELKVKVVADKLIDLDLK